MNCPDLSDLPMADSGAVGWPFTLATSPSFDVSGDFIWPRISIVTPSFNQGAYIEKTIRSVLLQGYPNIEYIIMDGGSTDDTLRIIRKYEHWLTFWVSEKDNGQSAAINKGFTKATGTIFGWLNSDDFFMPGALRNIAHYAAQNPHAGAFAGASQTVNVQGKIIRNDLPDDVTFYGILQNHGKICQACCLFTRDMFRECKGVDESLFIAMDLDLWLKIAQRAEIVKIKEHVATDLYHDQAKTVNKKFKIDCATERILVLARYDESLARKELAFLARFYQKVSSLPFYPVFRIIYRLLNKSK
jgi:glycosyltransferase involved in cell wall biosynthesis